MTRIQLSLSLSLTLALLLVTSILPAGVFAMAADWDLPNGHHFTQAGDYSVVDNGEARFWSEFQRHGGVARLGYPISGRFVYKGFTTQVFQKVALQWRADEGRALFVNVFDELSQSGKDDWLLTVRSTPKPIQLDERGKGWNEVVAGRLALLESNPAISDAYYSVANPIESYGLPTSRVEDLGPLYAIRAQRVVLQQWKVNTAWCKAGEVVVANGGDVAKEAGIWPLEAMSEVRVSDDPPILQLINQYRAAAGVPPARINPSLEKAAQNHVRYYDANRGDPHLAGMGLHQEQAGKPGYTGASMGDRARAAGYSGGAVTENAGWGGLKRVIEWCMSTVNHRLPLIHPGALDMGYAESKIDGFTIISVGVRWDKLNVPLPSMYPQPGATNVPTAWDGGETPNPAPGIPRPLGYPITVAFGANQKVEWISFELRGPDGQPLAISTPKTSWMRAAAIIPHRPLEPGKGYTALVEATVDGKAVTKEWSFTTRP